MNDTNSQLQRDAIAIEVNQVLEAALVQGNRFANGRYVFGGTRSLALPFESTRNAQDEITAVNYVGNDKHFEIEIGEGIVVPVNETGTDVFTNSGGNTVDIFRMLIDIRDNLRGSNVPGLSTNLGQFDQAQEQLLIAVAHQGAVQNRFESVDDNLRDINNQLQETLSDNIDADFAEVMLNLNAQTNAFEASLSAGSRVILPSLLDFLR